MIKKLCIVFMSIVLALSAGLMLTACGDTDNSGGDVGGIGQEKPDDNIGGGTSGKDLIKITGVTFDNKTVTYDGQQHAVTVTGVLPQGVTVAYKNNSAVNAGTYEATATLSGENYETLTLNAALKINKALITGITFGSETFAYDGQQHAVIVTGVLPQGVTVAYKNNSAVNVGTYEATATLSGENYETLTLNATLKITASEKERAIYYFGNALYFANALDGDKLYSYVSGAGVQKVSSDNPHDFTVLNNTLYFRSAAAFMSSVKSVVSGGVDTVASEKGEYLCSDGTNLYFAKNGLTANSSGIYKLTLGSEPTVTLLSAGKAKYMRYSGGYLYFADGNNDGKLGRMSVRGGTRENVVDDKITCLYENGGMLYFTVDRMLGNYIAKYDIATKTIRKLTGDAGENLTYINGYLYYLNVDLLTSTIYGKGIYRVNASPSSDVNASGEKIIGDDGKRYSSLTAAGSKLAYYKVDTQMLCVSATDGSGEQEILDGFVAPETVPLSLGSKVLSHGGNVYFMDLYNDKALYAYNPTADSLMRITTNKVSDFSIIGDWLYYNQVSYGLNNDLYKLNLVTGGDSELISKNDCVDIVSDGNNIYYVEKNAGGARTAVRKIDANGTDTVLYDKGATSLTYYDGAIYFVDGKDLLKISTSDALNTLITVKKGNVDVFTISGGVVYFREMYGLAWKNKRLSRINTDGTDYAVIIEDDTDPLYISVVGDTVYYYSDILSDNGSGLYCISVNARKNETPKLILARNTNGAKYYAEQFTVAGGKIYFVNYYNNLGDSHLYSVNVGGGAPVKIA